MLYVTETVTFSFFYYIFNAFLTFFSNMRP